MTNNTKTNRTIYATFDKNGYACIGVWGWDRRKVEVMLYDRVANGDAFEGEHIEPISVASYNRLMAPFGMEVR